MVRNVLSFGGMFFCGGVAYAHTGSAFVGVAVAWALWIIMPDPPR